MIEKIAESPVTYGAGFLAGLTTLTVDGLATADQVAVGAGTVGFWLLAVGAAYARHAERRGYRRP